MRKVIGAAFVSLDGVMQAPGDPNEDPTGDFKPGGWLPKYFDEEAGKRVDALFAGSFDLLLGRRTFDIFAAYWPFVEGGNKVLGERFNHAAHIGCRDINLNLILWTHISAEQYAVARGIDLPLPGDKGQAAGSGCVAKKH